MALGTSRTIKREWSNHSQNDAAVEPFAKALYEEFNALCDALNALETAAYEAIITAPALAIGSNKPDVAHGIFLYTINGQLYYKAANTAGVAPGNDVIPQSTFGACAFDIGADGTVDAVEATANATGYASAALARAGVPAVAADHVRMGFVTASKSDGAFTFGTTNLDAANTTVAYTSTTPGSLLATITGVSKLSTIESGG